MRAACSIPSSLRESTIAALTSADASKPRVLAGSTRPDCALTGGSSSAARTGSAISANASAAARTTSRLICTHDNPFSYNRLSMQTLAAGMSYCDALFQGLPRIIAPALLHGAGGAAIVDPGPTSTLATVRGELETAGVRIADLTAILLTHIHLDHAGATGSLVRENPRIRVFVHEKGAPHMADPAKLLASAARLYGDAMDRLWGAFEPVPRDSMVVLRGGERIEAGGRALEVAYTPGHASHHVSYFSADTGIAFVGDTAGVKLLPDAFVLPATPPPDVDLELWSESFRIIDAWRPDALFLTHFGPSSPPR